MPTLLNLVFAIILICATSVMAVPTNVTVRVRTKDAKFMGSSIGGALITIRDADTGLDKATFVVVQLS